MKEMKILSVPIAFEEGRRVEDGIFEYPPPESLAVYLQGGWKILSMAPLGETADGCRLLVWIQRRGFSEVGGSASRPVF